MKRFCSAIWMCLILGLMPLPGQNITPTISFDGLSKDFGTVTQGDTLKHVFTFVNKGAGVLEISEVAPTWGCEATLLSAKQVKAGQSGRIEVRVKTEGMIGEVSKLVYVTTNDPGQPTVTLTMNAKIEPEIALSEPSIYFGNVPKGKEATKEVFITLPANKPIKILSAESADRSITVKIVPVPDTDGKKAKLLATQRADAKEGYHFGNIVVKTTSSLTPELLIPERGVIVPANP